MYSATKAAVRSLARNFTKELMPRGIRVNVVTPGLINTGATNPDNIPEQELEVACADIFAKVPLQRIGRPEDVAPAVLFLASEDSSYILGQEIVIDGGYTALG